MAKITTASGEGKAKPAATSKKAKENTAKKGIHIISKDGVQIIGAFIALFGTAYISNLIFADCGFTGAMLYSLANNGKLSGRADGNVYMRNGRVRAMKVPSLIRNVYTAIARGAFGSNSSAWNSLSDAQRQMWIDLQVQTSDRFGNIIILSGKSAFVQLNGNLNKINYASNSNYNLDTAAPISVIMSDVAISTGDGTIDADYAHSNDPSTILTNVPSNRAWAVSATAGLRNGVMRPKNSAFRLFGVLAGSTDLTDAATKEALYDAYVSRFGAVSGDTKIYFRIEEVSSVNGVSAALTQSTPATIS